MARTALVDATTNLVLATIITDSGYEPPEGQIAVKSDTANKGDGYDASSGVFTPPTISVTPAQLAVALVSAASFTCARILAQVVPDQTHQIAYANAAALVGPGAVIPSASGPLAAFTAMATAFGFGSNLQGFATLAVTLASASLDLSAILATVEAEAATSTTSAQLASSLSSFSSSINTFISAINSVGLSITITAPTAISIAGINA